MNTKPFWLQFSFLLHLLLLGLYLWLVPAPRDSNQQAADQVLSQSALEEISEMLLDSHQQDLAATVEKLEAIDDTLHEILEEKLTDFQEIEQHHLQNAPEKALAHMQQAVSQLAQKPDDPSPFLSETAMEEVQHHQEQAQAWLEAAVPHTESAAAAQREAASQLEAYSQEEQRQHDANASIPKLEQEQRQKEHEVRQASRELKTRQAERDRSQKQVEQRKQQVEELQQLPATKNRNVVMKRTKTLEVAQHRFAQAESSHEERAQRAAESKARTEAAEEALREAQNRVQAVKQEAAEAGQHIAATRVAAHAKQQHAIDQLKQLMTTDRVFPESLHSEELLAALQPNPPASGDSVAEWYEAAEALEQRVAERYAAIRATDLAALQEMPLQRALKNVDVAVTDRPELDDHLLSQNATTREGLQAQKAEIARALKEGDAMLTRSQSMLAEVMQRAEAMKSGFGLNLQEATDLSKAQQARAARASDEVSGTIVDLAQGTPGGKGIGPKSLGPPPPQLNQEQFATSRRFGTSGDMHHGGWMGLRHWYIIGPFPNPNRVNLDRRFPPETVIDLDAVYAGKYGRTLRWHSVFVDEPSLVPPNAIPYAIWYAYTEVYFGEAMDVWVAMGSDDKGKVWINDELIWVSADHHKNWTPFESQRKVAFPQGRSRILYRIENGHHSTRFSLLIHLAGTT